MPKRLQRNRLIVCEGQSDCAFFSHLIEARGLPDFDVFHPGSHGAVDVGGRAAFGEFLTGISATPGFDRLRGILVVSDNDIDPGKSFNEVCAHIRNAGLAVPAEPLKPAFPAHGPAVIIMMLPATGVEGNLEALCLPAAYDRNPGISECLEQYCICTQTNEWETGKASKMRLRALFSVAFRTDPNTSLVHAWNRTEDVIPLAHASFDNIANFLRDFDTTITPVLAAAP
ncbi:MAG TPA: DUF3226 domain-containing protein [Terriglobales bacterium]|nr:DUF3226 domain-containing protein [Terriglobales bacterium]